VCEYRRIFVYIYVCMNSYTNTYMHADIYTNPNILKQAKIYMKNQM